MRLARPTIAVLLAVLAVPAAAAAQTPAPPDSATPTTPTTTPVTPKAPKAPKQVPEPEPEPAPEPAAGTIKLGSKLLVFAGDRVEVKGRLTPASKGQRVSVRILRDGKPLKQRTVKVAADGRFSHTFGGDGIGAGNARVVAVHEASRKVARTRSKPRPFAVLEPSAPYGSRGASVEWLQRKLAQKHYAVPRNGVFDDATGRAVIAFRKLTGMSRTATADRAVFEALAAGKGAFKVKFPGHGKHVEGDLTHDVLALINADGKVHRIYHTSPGAPATPTILGTYRVYRKDYGTNSLGMVHAVYFIRGYAVHGYHSVPTYKASHGCFRVPVPNALYIYNWMDMGMTVDSYYR